MIKTKEIAGPSCLTSASDDEPLFVLRANDECAPGIVRAWAEAYKTLKGPLWSLKQVAKYDEALALATAMEDWGAVDRDSNNK